MIRKIAWQKGEEKKKVSMMVESLFGPINSCASEQFRDSHPGYLA